MNNETKNVPVEPKFGERWYDTLMHHWIWVKHVNDDGSIEYQCEKPYLQSRPRPGGLVFGGILMLEGIKYLRRASPVEVKAEAVADAKRYQWLNRQDNFMVYIDSEPTLHRNVRLKCGLPLDEWIDKRIADEQDTHAASAEGGDERTLLSTDAFCPLCGHNRNKSAISSIDHMDGTESCQMCGARWNQIEVNDD